MAGFANSVWLDSDLCGVKVVSKDRGFWLNRDRLVKPGAFASLAFSISGLQATCSSHEGYLCPLMCLTAYIFTTDHHTNLKPQGTDD